LVCKSLGCQTPTHLTNLTKIDYLLLKNRSYKIQLDVYILFYRYLIKTYLFCDLIYLKTI